MRDAVKIVKLAPMYAKAAKRVFEKTIPIALFNEGLEDIDDMIHGEVEFKSMLVDEALALEESKIRFLLAKKGSDVIGIISYGPCGSDIKKCTKGELNEVGELGSLYVLPEYQNQGVGSALIQAMLEMLLEDGIDEFCLDSGYKLAQKRWIKKFGPPYKVVDDYWGPGFEHMIWYCKTKDLLNLWRHI